MGCGGGLKPARGFQEADTHDRIEATGTAASDCNAPTFNATPRSDRCSRLSHPLAWDRPDDQKGDSLWKAPNGSSRSAVTFTGRCRSPSCRRRPQRGKIAPNTLICKGADGLWVCAERVEGLFQLSPTPSANTPPAVPLPSANPEDSDLDLTLEPEPVSPPLLALPSATPISPASGKPGSRVAGESPICLGLPSDSAPDSLYAPDRIHPVTWAAIFTGSGFVFAVCGPRVSAPSSSTIARTLCLRSCSPT